VISTIQENAMKKLIFVGLCVLSSAAFADGTAVCASLTSAAPGTAITGDGAKFVKVTFTPKCSANTHVAYEQDAVNFAAAGGSSKGKTVFGGSTGGGGVSPVAGKTCATGCGAADATGATAALLAAAGST
jgi:hypothetical protein